MCVPRTFGVTQAHGEGGDVLQGASVRAGGAGQAALKAGGGSSQGCTVPEQGVKPGDAGGEKKELGSGLKRRGQGSIHAQHKDREGIRLPAQAGGAAGLSRALLSPSVQPAARGVLLPPGSNYVPLNLFMPFL